MHFFLSVAVAADSAINTALLLACPNLSTSSISSSIIMYQFTKNINHFTITSVVIKTNNHSS